MLLDIFADVLTFYFTCNHGLLMKIGPVEHKQNEKRSMYYTVVVISFGF